MRQFSRQVLVDSVKGMDKQDSSNVGNESKWKICKWLVESVTKAMKCNLWTWTRCCSNEQLFTFFRQDHWWMHKSWKLVKLLPCHACDLLCSLLPPRWETFLLCLLLRDLAVKKSLSVLMAHSLIKSVSSLSLWLLLKRASKNYYLRNVPEQPVKRS